MVEKRICPDCGIPISDWARHRSGYRTLSKKGNIVYGSRCARQHIRHPQNKPKKGLTVDGKSHSQGY